MHTYTHLYCQHMGRRAQSCKAMGRGLTAEPTACRDMHQGRGCTAAGLQLHAVRTDAGRVARGQQRHGAGATSKKSHHCCLASPTSHSGVSLRYLLLSTNFRYPARPSRASIMEAVEGDALYGVAPVLAALSAGEHPQHTQWWGCKCACMLVCTAHCRPAQRTCAPGCVQFRGHNTWIRIGNRGAAHGG